MDKKTVKWINETPAGKFLNRPVISTLNNLYSKEDKSIYSRTPENIQKSKINYRRKSLCYTKMNNAIDSLVNKMLPYAHKYMSHIKLTLSMAVTELNNKQKILLPDDDTSHLAQYVKLFSRYTVVLKTIIELMNKKIYLYNQYLEFAKSHMQFLCEDLGKTGTVPGTMNSSLEVFLVEKMNSIKNESDEIERTLVNISSECALLDKEIFSLIPFVSQTETNQRMSNV